MLSQAKKGFTIIEVVIVLVIGAIIMLMVFLVVPQLQRSQRDARRQSDARRFLSAAEQFASNNNGNFPGDQTETTEVRTGYVQDEFRDPDGRTYRADGDAPQWSNAAANVAINGNDPRMRFSRNSGCDGQDMVTDAGNNNVAISVYQENGGRFCVQN